MEIKFFCTCGQKVSLPVEMLDRIGTCPSCNQPLMPPAEALEAAGLGSELGTPAVRDDGDSSALPSRSGGRGSDESSRRRAASDTAARRAGASRRESRRTAVPAQVARPRSRRSLPLWFYVSFGVDLLAFAIAWKMLGWSPAYAALSAEVGGWTMRAVLFKVCPS